MVGLKRAQGVAKLGAWRICRACEGSKLGEPICRNLRRISATKSPGTQLLSYPVDIEAHLKPYMMGEQP